MLLTGAQQAATLSVVVRPKAAGATDLPVQVIEPGAGLLHVRTLPTRSLDQPSPPGAVPSPAAWRGGRRHPRRLQTTQRASARPTPPRGAPSNCPATTRCVASSASGSEQTVATAGQPAARPR